MKEENNFILINEPPKNIIEWDVFGNETITINLYKKPFFIARLICRILLNSKWKNIK